MLLVHGKTKKAATCGFEIGYRSSSRLLVFSYMNTIRAQSLAVRKGGFWMKRISY